MSFGDETIGRTDEQEAKIKHSVVSGWLRCRLSFALLCTTLLCVRATRRKRFVIDNNIELADSATVVTFTQTSGSGAVSGLSSFPVTAGVASDTVTGTVVGPTVLSASGRRWT